MKPTKDNLKDELKFRIQLLQDAIKNNQPDSVSYMFLVNEHSIVSEIIELIELFDNRLGFEKFNASCYTPILDFKTNEPIKIGDFVDNGNGQCGVLKFNDQFNKYVIKTESGHIIPNRFSKINELYEYKIDTNRTECRRNHLKKKW